MAQKYSNRDFSKAQFTTKEFLYNRRSKSIDYKKRVESRVAENDSVNKRIDVLKKKKIERIKRYKAVTKYLDDYKEDNDIKEIDFEKAAIQREKGSKRDIPDEFEHGGIQYFKENLDKMMADFLKSSQTFVIIDQVEKKYFGYKNLLEKERKKRLSLLEDWILGLFELIIVQQKKLFEKYLPFLYTMQDGFEDTACLPNNFFFFIEIKKLSI